MRTISVRRKGNRTPFDIFRVDGHDPEQVATLAELGYICYAGCLLMSENIWDPTVVINGDWALYDGYQVQFVQDQFFEPPLAAYGGDSRTVKELWEEYNGRT